MTDPTKRQIGGTHYLALPIQPRDYIGALVAAGAVSWDVANAIKYLSRYRNKNGAQDLQKALHYVQLALATEYPSATQNAGREKADG